MALVYGDIGWVEKGGEDPATLLVQTLKCVMRPEAEEARPLVCIHTTPKNIGDTIPRYALRTCYMPIDIIR